MRVVVRSIGWTLLAGTACFALLRLLGGPLFGFIDQLPLAAQALPAARSFAYASLLPALLAGCGLLPLGRERFREMRSVCVLWLSVYVLVCALLSFGMLVAYLATCMVAETAPPLMQTSYLELLGGGSGDPWLLVAFGLDVLAGGVGLFGVVQCSLPREPDA